MLPILQNMISLFFTCLFILITIATGFNGLSLKYFKYNKYGNLFIWQKTYLTNCIKEIYILVQHFILFNKCV